MKVYLAGRASRAGLLREFADSLRRKGHECTSGWLYNEADPEVQGAGPLDYTSEIARDFARADLADVARSDVLVNITEPRGSYQRGGGRFVEIGYALGLGIPVVTVGEVENLFLGITDVYPNWQSYYATVKAAV